MKVKVNTKKYRRITNPTGKKIAAAVAADEAINLNRNEIITCMRDSNLFTEDDTLVQRTNLSALLEADASSDSSSDDDLNNDDPNQETNTPTPPADGDLDGDKIDDDI